MKDSSRSKKAFINMIAGFASEGVTLICGLILPRIILTTFGSNYNGLTSSINQFISVIALMKSGIGGVTRASLYKPLAECDTYAISAIIGQTEKFMHRIALIFVGFVLAFAAFYPTVLNHDFDFIFSFSLILIISMSTFAQYYFGLSAQMLLTADQRQYITTLFDIAKTIISTIISVIIIKLGFGIHIVKLGSSLVFVLGPIILNMYTKRRYSIIKGASSSKDLIKQRWDAVGHEVANFVNANTDIMILTVFSSLGLISVYTVYNYVIVNIRKVLLNFVSGFGAAFGNMYARKEYDQMRINLGLYELIVFSLTSVIYSVTAAMVTPFALLYTKGVNDVNYSQPLFGVILTLAGAFSCFRLPYQTITTSIGHYKQTRNGAFIEAGINIVLSICFVIKFGLIGVAIGTLASAIFRTVQYSIYLSHNVIKRSMSICILHIVIALSTGCAVYMIAQNYTSKIDTAFEWILGAIATTAIAFAITITVDLVVYNSESRLLISKMANMFKNKRSKIL
ncbi:lipopolysaccharide biosynthesis protein [Butyrivibrio sp. MC2013]|uniref:lipopolysaccharide biosynthesis protein n=1 Tax=Butyrivibrio sp. MC2013 TaxID=1280686 RepID=UPI0004022134|nr:polysaccharide biosynthesis C-terminal domain-containing protein [Butyrivibrio sp. MC2013]